LLRIRYFSTFPIGSDILSEPFMNHIRTQA
jgi:hypothetical protein